MNRKIAVSTFINDKSVRATLAAYHNVNFLTLTIPNLQIRLLCALHIRSPMLVAFG